MPNILGMTTERDLQDASATGGGAGTTYPQLKASLLICGETGWLMPSGGVPIRLSPVGTAKLLEKIADRASERLQRRAPSLAGESGRHFRSALGVSCKGPGAPLIYRVCPDCEAARLIAPLFGEGATLKSAGLI